MILPVGGFVADEPISRRPWHQLPCTRLYPNGSIIIDWRHPDAVDIWVEVNRRHRGDCALIVNDEVVHLSEAFPTLEAVSKALNGRAPWKGKKPII